MYNGNDKNKDKSGRQNFYVHTAMVSLWAMKITSIIVFLIITKHYHDSCKSVLWIKQARIINKEIKIK